jgi:hypothetical protein
MKRSSKCSNASNALWSFSESPEQKSSMGLLIACMFGTATKVLPNTLLRKTRHLFKL